MILPPRKHPSAAGRRPFKAQGKERACSHTLRWAGSPGPKTACAPDGRPGKRARGDRVQGKAPGSDCFLGVGFVLDGGRVWELERTPEYTECQRGSLLSGSFYIT